MIYGVKIDDKVYPRGVAMSKIHRMGCTLINEKKKENEEKESEKDMNTLDLRLPVMLLGGLPFNTIKSQLGNEKSELDAKMLDACLNPSWIGVLRDIGTVRARLLTALANGIIDMSFGEDNILHFSFSNPRFSGLDIDFNNQTFDDIGFDFERIVDEPEELLKYVLYIFKESIPHLQKEWGFSDEYIKFLMSLLDVDVIDDDISLKDLSDIYYVNRNRLPWRMFVGNNYALWEYHYGKDGRTFFDYKGETVTSTKGCTPMQHVWESSKQMSRTLITSIIGDGAKFNVKYNEKYFDESIDGAVDKRVAEEEKRWSKNKKGTAEEKGAKAEVKSEPAVAVEEKAVKKEENAEAVVAELKKVDKVVKEATEKLTVMLEEENIEAEVIEEIKEEVNEGDIEEEVTTVSGGVKSAVSAATKQFMAAEERANSRRYSATAIDNVLTARSNYVQERIESSEETQKRFKDLVCSGNSLIVVDCENAMVETIWGNIFRFTTKSTAKGQGGKLWLNARVLFVHDNDTTESADWATMINAFKKMVVVAGGIEDIRVGSVKTEKAKSLTDVAIGVHVGRMIGDLNKDTARSLVILSSDSDMAGIIQACKYIDPGIQYGVCYNEAATGKSYRAWCHTNGVCTFDADKYDTGIVEKYKTQMYEYIYEERYKDIIKGAVSEMMERKKGVV